MQFGKVIGTITPATFEGEGIKLGKGFVARLALDDDTASPVKPADVLSVLNPTGTNIGEGSVVTLEDGPYDLAADDRPFVIGSILPRPSDEAKVKVTMDFRTQVSLAERHREEKLRYCNSPFYL